MESKKEKLLLQVIRNREARIELLQQEKLEYEMIKFFDKKTENNQNKKYFNFLLLSCIVNVCLATYILTLIG